MKTPDKIYVSILPRTEHSIISEHCVGTAWDNKEHITIPNIKEYIRKDALMEWLEALKAQSLELIEAGYGDVFYGAQIAILEETIHKIESL